ncbi:DUF397 domain-containing protein [Streptomyces sp. NPDC085932]|uniref:DUF397 domain-containing protein n=1 Tax=Streptomyces sp. NPDC085932 TaxID=3365741 RepID=UPI0037D904DE
MPVGKHALSPLVRVAHNRQGECSRSRISAELKGVRVRPRRQRRWRKSSHSGANECLEVLEGPRICVRDSKSTDLGPISFGVNAWTAFVSSMVIPRSSPERAAYVCAHSQSP